MHAPQWRYNFSYHIHTCRRGKKPEETIRTCDWVIQPDKHSVSGGGHDVSTRHGKAQGLHHHGVGIDRSPNAVAQNDIALAGLFAACHQDAVLTSCLCKQMTGSSNCSQTKVDDVEAEGDGLQAKAGALQAKGDMPQMNDPLVLGA